MTLCELSSQYDLCSVQTKIKGEWGWIVSRQMEKTAKWVINRVIHRLSTILADEEMFNC